MGRQVHLHTEGFWNYSLETRKLGNDEEGEMSNSQAKPSFPAEERMTWIPRNARKMRSYISQTFLIFNMEVDQQKVLWGHLFVYLAIIYWAMLCSRHSTKLRSKLLNGSCFHRVQRNSYFTNQNVEPEVSRRKSYDVHFVQSLKKGWGRNKGAYKDTEQWEEIFIKALSKIQLG